MFAVNLLEEAGSGSGSVWIPVVTLGWFLLMTIVGWQISRRNATGDVSRLEAASPPEHIDPQ